MCTRCARVDLNHISIRSSSGFHRATWVNAAMSKSAPSSRFTTASTLRLNRAVTPALSS